MLLIYNGLNYTTSEINMNFRIKVNGIVDGKKINTLVGVYGLIKLVGVEMANKMLRRRKEREKQTRLQSTPGCPNDNANITNGCCRRQSP